MEIPNYSYLNPKLEKRKLVDKGGYGIFAKDSIQEGELLALWGGQVVTSDELPNIPIERQIHGIQVEDFLYLIPVKPGEDADYFNHSCTPNAGMGSPISLVAMKEILPDEEICFDYAMSDSSDYDEFICHCQSSNCRHMVTGKDWQKKELQQRYQGYFSPYLQRRINKTRT